MAEYRFDNGATRTADLISSQQDIDHICRCGYWGSYPSIGNYSVYLGITDGGFLVVEPDDENLIVE